MPSPRLIHGTLERYIFESRKVVMMSMLVFIKKLQEGAPTFIQALPELPPLVDRLKQLWPEVPEQTCNELKESLTALAAANLSFEFGGSAERFCLETMITRLIDSFEYYLTQIVARCLRTYPDALGDSQISIRELRECGSIDEAVDRRIERKVHDLTRAGLTGIADFLNKRFGADIDRKTDSYRVVCEAIEVRHLILHKEGMVDRIFISRTDRSDLSLGQLYPLDWKFALATLDAFSDVAVSIDSAIIRRFNWTE